MAKVKGIVDETIQVQSNECIFIHNVGGVDLYIYIDTNAKMYDLVLFSVEYEDLADSTKKHNQFMLSSKEKIGRESYDNAKELIQRITDLISAELFI
ncbi:hypothetical protein [Helicobacter cinaedi]|uniref:hypothetical protein n=1 Tax=Helicobacter cinaedi TaxID=213 RepID=UPI000D7C6E64|nr:hypothetical protein [Helicobacter cinaedi]